MSIAFHGTPIVPVIWNGRAARTTRDSTTRASEDKANPVPARTRTENSRDELESSQQVEPTIVKIASYALSAL
jgi:hypothetical protein